ETGHGYLPCWFPAGPDVAEGSGGNHPIPAQEKGPDNAGPFAILDCRRLLEEAAALPPAALFGLFRFVVRRRFLRRGGLHHRLGGDLGEIAVGAGGLGRLL